MDIIEEEINEIYPFVLEDFSLDMANDFDCSIQGKTKYFTESMVEEYIDKCMSVCKKELETIQYGNSYLSIRVQFPLPIKSTIINFKILNW